MKHPDDNIVIKYFDLIDEFIRIRCCSEEVLAGLPNREITNKSSYRKRIVETCVPEFSSEIINAIAKLDEDYDLEVLEELLYQICIDVNPNLEIHQVNLPNKTPDNEDPEQTLIPRPDNQASRSTLYKKALGLEKSLRRQIIGQDEAITSLVRAVKKSAVGLKRPGSPIGTFLLVGQTGTGKTELAKALTRSLYNNPGQLVRIDCSEYALPHEYAKLIGSPPGYIGHSEGGYLTETVRKKKDCVVLFDEIEKAHSKVHNLLLQLLDEGVLTDSKGQTVSFSRATVILTSNLGIEKIDSIRSRMGFKSDPKSMFDGIDLKAVTLEAMKEFFRPEFINRIDEVIVFNPLDVDVCVQIAHRMLKEVASLLMRNGIQVEFSPGIKNMLAREGFSEEYGARELRRLIKKEIEDPLTDLILADSLGPGTRMRVRLRGKRPVFSVIQGSQQMVETT